ASFWSALPLQHFASGTGLLTARSGWGASANVVALQIGNPLEADHESLAPGQLEIQRGNDALLIHPNALLGPLDPNSTSGFSNVVVVDSHGDTYANGDPVQTYPFNMGGWYGTPGVTVNAYEAAGDYVYLSGDYHAAYSSSNHDGEGGPTSELTRQLVYLRPDY